MSHPCGPPLSPTHPGGGVTTGRMRGVAQNSRSEQASSEQGGHAYPFTEHLEHRHRKYNCSCWLWTLILLLGTAHHLAGGGGAMLSAVHTVMHTPAGKGASY